MSTVRRKLKPGIRLKTLRASVAPTYTSLQSELVMLLHQKERLEQEESNLKARLAEVKLSLVQVSQQTDSIRQRAIALEGAQAPGPLITSEDGDRQPSDESVRIRERGRGMRFKQMTLHY